MKGEVVSPFLLHIIGGMVEEHTANMARRYELV